MLFLETMFVILFLLIGFGFLTFGFDALFGKLDFVSSNFALEKALVIIKDRKLDGGSFFDLGSCRGSFAAKMAKKLPQLHVRGIDDSWFRTLCASIRSTFLKNADFSQGNIFTTNVSSADIVYLYLPQELMPELENKLQKELKPGSLVISNSVSFPSWQASESFILQPNNPLSRKLFVYAKI